MIWSNLSSNLARLGFRPIGHDTEVNRLFKAQIPSKDVSLTEPLFSRFLFSNFEKLLPAVQTRFALPVWRKMHRGPRPWLPALIAPTFGWGNPYPFCTASGLQDQEAETTGPVELTSFSLG